MARASQTARWLNEQCWTVLGERRGRVWFGRRVRHARGEPVSVRFDGLWVLEREERRQDVLGFFHTHPGGPPAPSARDVRTMRALVQRVGKPLLCYIASPEGLQGYCFFNDQAEGVKLAFCESFPRGVIIGVEGDG